MGGDTFCVIFGVDTNFYQSVDEVTKLKSALTITLYSYDYYDAQSDGLEIVTNKKYSSDVRYFVFDLFSGELLESNSTDDGKKTGSDNLIVKTEDTTNDDGNVTDRNVTSVVVNDSDTGQTVYYNIVNNNGSTITVGDAV